jgi:hypothetical protein
MLAPFSVVGIPEPPLDCSVTLEIGMLAKLVPFTMKRLPGAIP